MVVDSTNAWKYVILSRKNIVSLPASAILVVPARSFDFRVFGNGAFHSRSLVLNSSSIMAFQISCESSFVICDPAGSHLLISYCLGLLNALHMNDRVTHFPSISISISLRVS